MFAVYKQLLFYHRLLRFTTPFSNVVEFKAMKKALIFKAFWLPQLDLNQ
jgi:hypothetical protein